MAGDLELAIVGGQGDAQLLAATTEAGLDAEWAKLEKSVRASELPDRPPGPKTLTAWKAEIRTS